MQSGQLTASRLPASQSPFVCLQRSPVAARQFRGRSLPSQTARLTTGRRGPPTRRVCRCQVHTVQTDRQQVAPAGPEPYQVPTYVKATGRIVASETPVNYQSMPITLLPPTCLGTCAQHLICVTRPYVTKTVFQNVVDFHVCHSW